MALLQLLLLIGWQCCHIIHQGGRGHILLLLLWVIIHAATCVAVPSTSSIVSIAISIIILPVHLIVVRWRMQLLLPTFLV